jgi:hypothetical protein
MACQQTADLSRPAEAGGAFEAPPTFWFAGPMSAKLKQLITDKLV